MSLSMYQASVPMFIHMLQASSAILAKASAWAEEKQIAPEVLLNARLAPDMYALPKQIQIATDVVKGCAARLAGVEIPSYADDEASFDELQARISKTIAFLQAFTPQQIDGSEGRSIELKLPNLQLSLTGQEYLLGFVQPNVYFHLSTAYAILRHNGVPLGKMDFLGRA
ncbi:DUF1993 domain-containing protein [Atopomonas sediminilitoris]|uniref:DUF1993 domain-containing protein n=1 Tax=Atopomonas sediminilitoris TaxID=2919919 RepID=UPI001F4DB020|nr:DUF1993 domain-containing protein [Atopomonas sediminilitoris]MCJ8169793.1 DUF1993 domain-containing protein [Atopomonas sediminilitoris]